MDIEWAEATADAMAADRAAMMQADAWRSLVMILLAAGGVALFALRRINRYVLTGLLAGVMLLDLVPVDLRFLSSENFVSPRRNQVTASAADKAIMQDKDPGYRVLNLTVSPFNDATTSYFHRSVGGYHGAKLARYQDLIDRYLANADDGVLDMLNTRYLIVPGKEGQPEAQRRTTAFGAAWFVDSVVYAPLGTGGNRPAGRDGPSHDGGGVVERRGRRRPRPDALRQRRIRPDRTHGVPPELPQIRIHDPRRGGGGVLGDFYDQGWKAYVDGEESPYFRADYVLRAMTLPAGTHRRMAVPRTGLDGRRGRDARGIARDPAGSRRRTGLLFQKREEKRGIKRAAALNPFAVSNRLKGSRIKKGMNTVPRSKAPPRRGFRGGSDLQTRPTAATKRP